MRNRLVRCDITGSGCIVLADEATSGEVQALTIHTASSTVYWMARVQFNDTYASRFLACIWPRLTEVFRFFFAFHPKCKTSLVCACGFV